MITALALVCLYAEPSQCVAMASKTFYSTEEECFTDRIVADEILTNATQGVVAYRCIEWGEPT